ncbi:MAG: isoprenylcysteine carboxylmethyltransferase family protein [Chloroflexi bacterium]|nr:isoprenylcysteine carboxylmethyltransferase family protein [Chloroflexota bacterium]
MRFHRFIYSSRGLYLLAAQVVILWLKQRMGSGVSLPLYLALLTLVVAAQLFRTWAAGFVGTTARGREVYGAVLLTAGPYARVRNPMYLGNLIITTTLAVMSGLWYAPFIAWVAYAFVYSNVIPYEETYLQERFGEEYEAYYRTVPRLLPTLRGYPQRRGIFRLREGLANEVAAWIVMPMLCYLFWVL